MVVAAPNVARHVSARTRPLVIAHRACPRGGPENSLSGVERARLAGADMVEIDVRRSFGGTPVLVHDSWLTRTARVPFPVRWTPARVMTKLKIERTTERVPTLAALLAALPESLGVALDIKDPGAGPATLVALRDAGFDAATERVLWWSQHEPVVRYGAQHAPGLQVALLRDAKSPAALAAMFGHAVEWGARAVSIHESVARPEVIIDANKKGLAVYCWIQSEAGLAGVAGLGLAGVVTDWPESAPR